VRRRKPARAPTSPARSRPTPNSPGGAPLAGVHLRGVTLCFADGAAVKSVSVNGGPVTTVATANTTVLSITPAPNGVYWGDASGAIAGRINGAAVAVRPGGPLHATSLAFDGARVAATRCTSANACSAFIQEFPIPGLDEGYAAGRNAHFMAFNAAARAFWGDETGLRRLP